MLLLLFLPKLLGGFLRKKTKQQYCQIQHCEKRTKRFASEHQEAVLVDRPDAIIIRKIR